MTQSAAPAIAARLIDLHTIESDMQGAYGAITEVTAGMACPFEIKRIYWIHGAHTGEVRGHHAHRRLQQLLVAVAGAFEIVISDGTRSEHFRLDTPRRALLLQPGYWRTIHAVRAESVLLVAASAAFDESDYIRDHEEFVAYRQSLKDGAPGSQNT